MLNSLEHWWLLILLRRQFETVRRRWRGQPNSNERIQYMHLQLGFFQGHFTSGEGKKIPEKIVVIAI